jgi:hypothetical protein
MSLVQQWFKRKTSNGTARLQGLSTVTQEYTEVRGPRSIYGKVVIGIQPADDFTFVSSATWPSENYEAWVIDGILDALFCVQHKPLLGARFDLKEIGWHPVNSAPIAYYWAAKNAVAGMLASQRFGE